jgi:hypothetical protein
MRYNKLRCTFAVIAALIIVLPVPAQAADDEGSGLYKLFEKWTRLYDQGSLQARKVYFRGQLITLNQQLWKYEQDKRYLVLSLQRARPDWDEIETAASDLTNRIPQLFTSLDRLGSEMRTYDHTEDAAGQLSEALTLKRAAWLFDVQNVVRTRNANELPLVAKQGSDALKQLTEANKALARLIAKLDE